MSGEAIWWGEPTVEEITRYARGTLIETLGIEFTLLEPAALHARMPVDSRTVQPAGVLHGGASVALAETLASFAAHLTVDPARTHAVGQEINANHLRPVPTGETVVGVATPIALGRRSQVWEIRISTESGKLACISRCTIALVEQASSYGPPESRG
ncbi:MAG: hotdog fold thioesterase [Actinomycetales bacterium]|nr:hotdog fold thioesterase [Actinomycetales bacterium]